MIFASKVFGKLNRGKSKIHFWFESAASYGLVLFITYVISDLGVLYLRNWTLPQKPSAPRLTRPNVQKTSDKSVYQSIINRNLFSRDGVMPDALAEKNSDGSSKREREAAPVLSQLPLELVGTIVLSKAEKSVANIDVKSKNIVIAVTPGRIIDNIATLVRVERNKAIIRNNNLGRLEYLEIKDQNKISFSSGLQDRGHSSNVKEVKQVAPNRFVLKRETVLKHTLDLSNLLMQASSVPRRKANGDVECYILTSFKEDSIFADLGINQGDCIKTVNGEAINSPAKALEVYGALKNASSVKIVVESDGRDVQKEYTIE